MANKKRDYEKYELRQGRKVVYRGITNDLERRVNEHEAGGKKFSSVNKVGSKVTRGSAKQWEEKSLTTYRQTHKGKNPKYNINDKG
ncbi:GIY-YIG nuclease family protein [bacterium]|nr:GIY-YIG nuclease family protein [bacterium]